MSQEQEPHQETQTDESEVIVIRPDHDISPVEAKQDRRARIGQTVRRLAESATAAAFYATEESAKIATNRQLNGRPNRLFSQDL